MTTPNDARKTAAENFTAAIEKVYACLIDRQTSAVELSAFRARYREIAGIECERLLAASADFRNAEIKAMNETLAAALDKLQAARTASNTANQEAIAAMEALYGGAGGTFARGNRSVKEVAADQALMQVTGEVDRIKAEIEYARKRKDDSTPEEFSVSYLATLTPANVAQYAAAYFAAAIDGKLVA